MIEIHRENDSNLLIAKISGEIAATDWDTAAPTIDQAIAECGNIVLLIDAREFDGWQNLAAARAHIAFVKAHHTDVARVAALAPRQWQHWLVALAKHFVSAQLKAFEPRHIDAALDWLRTGRLLQPSVSIETAEQDHVLLLRFCGRLSHEDYKNMLLPLIESTLESQQTIDLVVDLTEFEGGDIDAFLQDMTDKLLAARHIERIAVVAEQPWMERAAQLSQSLPLIAVRAFLPAEWQRARRWAAG
jgi:hypothetical protein